MLRRGAIAFGVWAMLGAAHAQPIQLNVIQESFELSRVHILSIEAVKDGEYWNVVIKLSAHQLSASWLAQFGAFSGRNIGKPIQWAVGDRIVTVSVIRSAIAGDTFLIGGFNEADARSLVAKLLQ